VPNDQSAKDRIDHLHTEEQLHNEQQRFVTASTKISRRSRNKRNLTQAFDADATQYVHSADLQVARPTYSNCRANQYNAEFGINKSVPKHYN